MTADLDYYHDDLHCHLYGCLTVHDIWHLGRQQLAVNKDEIKARLQWYGDEFEKVFGHPPQTKAYWDSCLGVADIAADYQALDPISFATFQAKFNLLIALFPLNPADPKICHEILLQQRRSGVHYGEYRVPVPPYFTKYDAQTLWTKLSETCQLFAKGEDAFQPRLVVSLPRDPEKLVEQYGWLKEWQKGAAKLSPFLVGIDLCGYEEDHHPALYQAFTAKLHEDNSNNPATALAFLVHGGETFESLRLESSARRVFELAAMGVHRIGHGIALGFDPKHVVGKAWRQTNAERQQHLGFLLDQADALAQQGFEPDYDVAKELTDLAKRPAEEVQSGIYTEAEATAIASFQDALMALWPRFSGGVIECCPTSNLVVGKVPGLENHPIRRFLQADLPVIVASDDPGMFDTDIICEQTRLIDHQIISPGQLTTIGQTAHSARAEKLVGRPHV